MDDLLEDRKQNSRMTVNDCAQNFKVYHLKVAPGLLNTFFLYFRKGVLDVKQELFL